MNPSGAGRARGAGTAGSALRRGWAVVLAVTAIVACAAFFAMSLVPPVYRAAIEMSGDDGLSARWENASLIEIAGSAGLRIPAAASEARRPSPFLVRVTNWIEGEGWAAAGRERPAFGLQPAAGGKLIVWADAADPATARARADTLADHVAASENSLSNKPAPTLPEPEPADPEPLDLGIVGLRQQLAEAEERAASASSRRDEFAADRDAAALSDDAVVDEKLRAAAARRADLRGQLAALDRAEAAANDGNVADGAAETRPIDGWSDLQRLARQKQELGASVASLSRTLLDDHPRMAMAKLRLQDIDGEMASTRARVEQDITQRAAGLNSQIRRVDQEIDTLSARRAALGESAAQYERLARAAELEQGITERLRAALRTAQAKEEARPVAKSLVSLPEPARIERIALPIEKRTRQVLPVVAVAAMLGLVASAGSVVAAGLLRSKAPQSASVALTQPILRKRRASRPDKPAPVVEEATGPEVAAVDDVIDAIVSSGISRAMLASPRGRGERPLGVDIVRRLALRGQSAAIVDISDDQSAAQAMGATRDWPGLSDLIEGNATFATIARRDFATRAEIVAGGRHPPTSKLDTHAERRNVLDFVERSYETIVVDCGRMPAETIHHLMDGEAALLVAVEGCTPAEIEMVVEEFKRADLHDVILVGEPRSFL